MKNNIITILTILLCILSPISQAGEGVGTVEIEHVGLFNGKELAFFYTATRTGQPTCNAYRSRFVLDISTSLGKSQYSLLLAAQASGKQVKVWGTNTCTLWNDSEDVNIVGYVVDYAKHP